MTVQHAIKEGITTITLPGWHPQAKVELELLPNGEVGYFSKVYNGTMDREGRAIYTNVQSWNFINDTFDGWEVWRA